MAKNKGSVQSYVDFTTTLPEDPAARKLMRDRYAERMRREFDDALPGMVKRHFSLPPLLTKVGDYVAMLDEARRLYVHGFYYGCVLMCAVTAERITKDMFVAAVLKPSQPVDLEKAVAALEFLSWRHAAKFLKAVGKMDDSTCKEVDKLSAQRNPYAHARGHASAAEAKKALGRLHAVVEGTVSWLKDNEIVDGVLTPRRKRAKG